MLSSDKASDRVAASCRLKSSVAWRGGSVDAGVKESSFVRQLEKYQGLDTAHGHGWARQDTAVPVFVRVMLSSLKNSLKITSIKNKKF